MRRLLWGWWVLFGGRDVRARAGTRRRPNGRRIFFFARGVNLGRAAVVWWCFGSLPDLPGDDCSGLTRRGTFGGASGSSLASLRGFFAQFQRAARIFGHSHSWVKSASGGKGCCAAEATASVKT